MYRYKSNKEHIRGPSVTFVDVHNFLAHGDLQLAGYLFENRKRPAKFRKFKVRRAVSDRQFAEQVICLPESIKCFEQLNWGRYYM